MANTVVRRSTIGYGLFAHRSYLMGEVVDVEEPEFISHVRDATHDNIDATRHNARFAWSLVDRIVHDYEEDPVELLDKWTKVGYATGLGLNVWEDGDDVALAMIVGTDDRTTTIYKTVRQLYDIVATTCYVASTTRLPVYRDVNGAPCQDKVARTYGFYPRFGFINHACKANMVNDSLFEDEDGPRTLYALRDISFGEELTMDYMSPQKFHGPLNLRPYLLELFGFRCKCGWCITMCSNIVCGKKSKRVCSCMREGYCGKACQRDDWKRHKAEHTRVKAKARQEKCNV